MTAINLLAESNSLMMDKWRYDDAECKYQMEKSGGCVPAAASACSAKKTCCATKTQGSAEKSQSSLVNEIAKARQHIQNSLKEEGGTVQVDNILTSRLEAVEHDNKDLRKVTQDLQAIVKKLESRISALEAGSATPKEAAVVTKQEEKGEAESDSDSDSDFDPFASDDEEVDEAAEKAKEELVKAYQARKSKKPIVIAKSNIIIDVKPWDDETDMNLLEAAVRNVTMDGLLWGTGKFVEVGYGIKKLTITMVVVDDKVSMEDLENEITANEDLIQSVDIVAFNKI